jgi:hypothetical protein
MLISYAILLGGAILITGIIPGLVQQFSVIPNQLQRELPYIKLNIEFTRRGYNLQNIEVRPFLVADMLSAGDFAPRTGATKRIPIWDERPLGLEALRDASRGAGASGFRNDAGADRWRMGLVLDRLLHTGANTQGNTLEEDRENLRELYSWFSRPIVSLPRLSLLGALLHCNSMTNLRSLVMPSRYPATKARNSCSGGIDGLPMGAYRSRQILRISLASISGRMALKG